MADYRPLDPVQVTAALDTTGANAGNYTSAFTAQQLPNVNVWELYHMTVTGGPALATAKILLGNRTWSYVQLDVNGGNEWDPSQPVEIRAQQELFFLWAVAAAGNPAPVCTVWPRYDATLPENAYAAGG